jgi:hypothetical protein
MNIMVAQQCAFSVMNGLRLKKLSSTERVIQRSTTKWQNTGCGWIWLGVHVHLCAACTYVCEDMHTHM